MAKLTDNYNIDFRRLVMEKMKSWKFVVGTIAGSALTLIPWVVNKEGGFALSIGLLIVWWMLVMVYAGVNLFPFQLELARDFAKKHKLSFVAHADSLVPLSYYLSSVTLFSPEKKRRQQVRFTMAGLSATTPAFPLVIFRYSFEYRAFIRNNLYEFTTIVLETRVKDFPEFIIDSRAIYDFNRFVQPTLKEKITLEGSFGRNYDVYVSPAEQNMKRLLALSVLTPDFMSEFMQHLKGTNMIVEDGKIILLTRKDIYFEGLYEEYLATLRSLYAKIVRQVKLREGLAEKAKR